MIDREAPADRREELLDELVELFLAEGFLRFSVEDLARRLNCSKTTLYQVAPSKEQVILTVVRAAFRRSTDAVEAAVAATTDPVGRIAAYLDAISAELAPAGPQYYADLDTFVPAREIYRQNTRLAARRLQDLVQEAAPRSHVRPEFTGNVAALVMAAIQRGEMEAATGLDDATCFHELALLITSGIQGRTDRPSPERTPA
ncbi:transcriptional regulator, TetR family [Aeromicrobium marinum DSM 15272]|uniref:Transcriptional regulator, TetR family n=1 Tax=Aeromicrobium marinum DSM 15272 TaxID=585531 RepID=E2SDB4_9ACTN|nr:TetR/AcrR family transcriptional regulator [Aeromicrobium marinum]EFQ82491.1 transcriptional regulator, TetR family [Aeromicrobium marinum DSM 15272]